MRKLSLLLRLLAAGILLQTLFFKFTGAAESVYIFSTIGAEPGGRLLSGVVELLAAILLLIPATQVYGAGLASMVMLGALSTHLLFLGIEVQGDGGALFALAWITLLCSLGTIWIARVTPHPLTAREVLS
ncbi:MAG: DoxX family protein [Myxococcota bacterium]